MTFVLQNLTNLLYTKRMGRFHNGTSLKHITDLVLLVISIVVISWIHYDLKANVKHNYSMPGEEDEHWLLILNFSHNLDFNFKYLFATIVSCLIVRISVMLEFHMSVGPLIKILIKMM